MSEPITIILVDDHTMVRGALKIQIEREPNLTVVGEASTADEAITAALELKPDVILMDIEMPGQQVFEAARTIKSRLPQTHIVFLTAFSRDSYIEQAISLEASGYLIKTEPMENLVAAIHTVMGGGICYSSEVQARMVINKNGRLQLNPSCQSRLATLTERELVVLRYIAQGLAKKEIAQKMSVTPSAIDRHCTRLMTKLDLHDRVQLARFAIREGLVEA